MSQTRGGKLYTCFIDLRKAFDSIWHDGLFRKLENLGVNGNFLEIIKNIFKKTTCAVKLNGKITNFFPYDKGVQQGNHVSPLLFNLYVDDIFQHIANKDPVSLNNTTLINALMYADDLSLLSTSKDGLQSSLTSLHEYCHKWRLDINHKKSKVMVFPRGTQKEKNKYTINNIPLDIVKDYKYLGITLNSKNCSFVQTLSNLQVKGTMAMYSLLSHLPLKLLSIKTLLRLFDSCIAPIITYGSEVWGPYVNNEYTKWNTNPIERLHMQCLKRILGVNRSTTNELVRAELGRFPILSQVFRNNINYIQSLRQQKDNSTLVKQAFNYESMTFRHSPTILSMTKMYDDFFQANINVNTLYTNRNNMRTAIQRLFTALWQTNVQTYTKAQHYIQFKTYPKFENYLSLITNRKHRVSYTEYRLSDHRLNIEQGRHKTPRTPRELRICPLCKVCVEDEIHFLINCTTYTDRNDLFHWITENHAKNFENLNPQQKFVFLVSQENDSLKKKLVNKISTWSSKREDLLNIQK